MPLTSVSTLYPVLDRQFLPEDPAVRSAFLEHTVHEFAAMGIRLVQLRWKHGNPAQIRVCAETMLSARSAPLRCILNDDPVLARDLGLDGVHLGQDDMLISDARPLLGADAVLGVSTHRPAQVIAANQTSADYIAIGPVFGTSTKKDAEPVIGLEGVRAARALTKKPLVAIGGITLANAASVREAGADAVAVISALFGHPGQAPAKLAKDFLERLR